ncbi:MAG: 60S ribosomal protein L31 [Acidilobaceae archaeon]|nr:60S ribosomal protein L31 [Acidilobaceae archaeon]MCX8165523.1 60S ribosomal protein L31 [Acidilobaceae archaeon]MDW7973950.1 50S ribosomal protein L31e [Sulfolobales archaeon]
MPERGKWVFVVPFGEAYRGKRVNRADRAIRLLREFVKRHTKAERVLIMNEVNEVIWERSRERPPRRIKVVVDVKTEKPEGEEKEVRIARVRLAAERLKPGPMEGAKG